MIIEALRSRVGGSDLDILEFGSGDGFQIPYLQRLGRLVASDVYRSELLDRVPDPNFVLCSITDTPFESGRFDVVFSNHVIEHVDDLPGAFREMRRIGKAGCVYAFSVPTNVWLALSVPGQYFSRAAGLLGKLRSKSGPRRTASGPGNQQGTREARARPRGTLGAKLLRQLLPTGHGTERRFLACYRRFRIGTWEALFRGAGFEILETRPLLLYGPSKWPIIPTMPGRGGACSSVLFVMGKATGPMA